MTRLLIEEFIPEDRRTSPPPGVTQEQVNGTAVFVDVVGFTRLTEDLVETKGRKLGAELIYDQLQTLFAHTLATSQSHGGTAVAFAGDAVTLFFDADRLGGSGAAAHRAAQVAQLLARAPDNPLRISLSSGRFLRKMTGDADLGRLDLFAGEAAQELAALDTMSPRPAIVICAETKQRIAAIGGITVALPLNRGSSIVHLPDIEPQRATRITKVALSDALEWVPLPLRGLAYALCTAGSDKAQGGLEAAAQIRTVVAVFVHIRGLDVSHPEDETRLETIIERIQSLITHQGGTVLGLNTDEKGSYLSAVFGAPVAHENDVLRAVLAADTIARAAAKTGVDVGIGIFRGSALSGVFTAPGRARYDVTGTPMSHAARLMVAAAPNEVLVGDRIAAELSEKFVFATCKAASAKRLVKATGASVPKPHVAGTRLVDRSTEKHEILSTLAKGPGSKVVIEALPGIGKSALLEHVRATDTRADTLWLSGGGEEISRDLAYHAWRQIASYILGLTPLHLTDDAKAVMSWLAYGQGDLPSSVTAVTGPERGSVIASQVTEVLAAVAATRPVALSFDDTHWMDTPSLTLLHGVVKAGAPVALLIAKRPDPPATMEAAMLFSAPDVKTISLQPLSDKGVINIVCAALGAKSLGSDLERLIVEKSGGSPLFAGQIGRALKEQGYVRVEGTHCLVAPGKKGLDRIDFLETVEAAILARLDTLKDRTKRVAVAASVHGRSFSRQAVEIALGVEMPPDVVAEELRTLQHEGYIAAINQDADREFRFSHALVQDAIGDSMPFTARCDINRRLSEWWGTFSSPEAIQRRARHLTLSLPPDERDPEILEPAIEALEAAAHQAANESANLEASQFHEQAIGFADRLPDSVMTRRKRLHLLASRAYSLSLFRGYGDPTVEEAYKAALELSDKVDKQEDLVFTLYGLFSFYASRGDYADSAPILGRIKALAIDSKLQKLQMLAHQTDAIQRILTGDIATGTALARQSIDEATALGDGILFSQAGAGDWRVYSGSWEALGHAIQGDWHGARRAHATALTLGDSDHFARDFVCGFAPLPVLAAAPNAALSYAEALVTDADRRGFPLFSIIGRIYLGWAAAKLGHTDDRVETFLHGQLQISQAMKLDSFNPYFLTLAAEAHLAINDVPLAREKITEAHATVSKCGTSVFLPEVLRAEAQVQHAEGAPARKTRATLDQAIKTALDKGAVHFAYLAAHQARQLGIGRTTVPVEALADRMRQTTEAVDFDGPLSSLRARHDTAATSDA